MQKTQHIVVDFVNITNIIDTFPEKKKPESHMEL